MPWQQYVADVILEIDPATGRLAYSQFGLTVPRQSGKSVFVLAKSVHRASATRFFGRRQNIIYTAQTRKDARKKWEEDYAADIEGSRIFKSKVVVHKGNGNEHFRFTNGSRFGIESATEKSGHGGTLDEAYIDEAFAQIDARLEQAFRPAMITRPNKQLGWISTAGWTNASAYLQGKVKKGRAAVLANSGYGLAYFEWSAPDDADPADPNVWLACMPALGQVRADGSGVTLQSIADEFETMDLPDFQRAYLNQWVPKPVEVVETVIPPEQWSDCMDADSKIVSSPVFALDVSPNRSWSAIAAAGLRADGLPHVEVTSLQGVVDHRPGVAWVVPRLTDLAARHKGMKVVIASQSAADSLASDLITAGVDVVFVKGNDVAAGCGRFFDLATTKGLRHIGQSELTTALAAARKNVDDGEGAWRWGRRKSSSDITPLYAATLALWAVGKASDYDPLDSIF